VSDSDKESSRREIRELREKLVNGTNAANAGATIARDCVAARDAVQKYFENVAIPLTEQTRNELVPQRKALVEKFNETKAKRDAARTKSENSPNDTGLRREWEIARDEHTDAGQKLDRFDKEYGPDIWDNADKLIRHYREEKTKHETPTRETANRLITCEKTVAVKYADLPSGL